VHNIRENCCVGVCHACGCFRRPVDTNSECINYVALDADKCNSLLSNLLYYRKCYNMKIQLLCTHLSGINQLCVDNVENHEIFSDTFVYHAAACHCVMNKLS